MDGSRKKLIFAAMMIEIRFDDEIRRVAPELRVLAIEATVKNPPTSEELWRRLDVLTEDLRSKYEPLQLNDRPGIAATRAVYKALGKDPNRYRGAAEALCRRAVRGLPLHKVSTLVDLINYVSLSTGYAIGGFDADKISGSVLTLGRGREGEPYEGIGRGLLNIEGMPVYRDNIGGVGTPTSDNERTKLTSDTCRLLMLVNVYGEETSLPETETLAVALLTEFASDTNINTKIFSPQ